MSGHSKWAQIKRQKGTTDAKRSTLFTKLSNAITLAAREGGANHETNFKLRLAIDQARQGNMPKDNIDRAIKRGTGELTGSQITETIYEAFGPGGSAIIIESLTDNKNRALTEIKNVLKNHGGRLAAANSALRLFARRGVIRLATNQPSDIEQMTMKIIDSGADDFKNNNGELIVLTSPNQLATIQKKLQAAQLSIVESGIELVPHETININNEQQSQIVAILEELTDCPDVNNIYTNVQI